MLKAFAVIAALFAGSAAIAGVGTPPIPSNGFGAVDGTWLNGLAGGLNETYQYGLTATGSTQAGAAQMPSGIALLEVDSSTASTGIGIALPFCYQGMELSIYDNTANNLTAYPNVTNNPQTAAQDTINNTTSVTITAHTPEYFSCAKNGIWSAK